MGRDAPTLWNPNLFSLAQDRRSPSEPFHLLPLVVHVLSFNPPSNLRLRRWISSASPIFVVSATPSLCLYKLNILKPLMLFDKKKSLKLPRTGPVTLPSKLCVLRFCKVGNRDVIRNGKLMGSVYFFLTLRYLWRFSKTNGSLFLIYR